MSRRENYPTKTTMNLFYKPDRTTKPSTIALYVLFALVVFLALSKYLVYDVWMEKQEALQALAAAQEELDGILVQLTDYDEVQERYFRYSATDEERALVDRMDVLAMLDGTMGNAQINSISINGSQLQIQISDVTLEQVAGIVGRLEAEPMVADTVVHTASKSGGSEGSFTNWWGETYTSGDWELVQANITVQLQKVTAEEEMEVDAQ